MTSRIAVAIMTSAEYSPENCYRVLNVLYEMSQQYRRFGFCAFLAKRQLFGVSLRAFQQRVGDRPNYQDGENLFLLRSSKFVPLG
jgi:hypothetical protein